MATLTIDGIDETLVDFLKSEAVRHNRSVDAELAAILHQRMASGSSRQKRAEIARKIADMTPSLGAQTDTLALLKEDRLR